MFIREVSWTNI